MPLHSATLNPALQTDTYQMRVFDLFYHSDIVQLDIEVLIDALECAADRDVVLELYRDFVVHQRLEEGEEQHDGDWRE